MSNLSQFLRGAVKISYDNATSGLTAVNVQTAIDEIVSSLGGSVGDLSSLQTLTGMPTGSTSLGTFTGTTIPDSSTIKAALQALETAVEARALDANVVHKTGDTMTGKLIFDGITGAAIDFLGDNTGFNSYNVGAISFKSSGTDIAVMSSAGINLLTGRYSAGTNTSATSVAYSLTNVNNTGMYGTATTLGFSISGTSVMSATATSVSGNVPFNFGANKVTSTYVPANNEDLVNKAYVDSLITGSGYALAADVIRHDGTVAFTGDQSMGGFKLTNLATPTLSGDAVNKSYVDTLVATGTRHKGSVAAATTANITLAGTQTIDGIAVVADDLVLVKNQTNQTLNGVYVVAAGVWVRSENFDGNPTSEIQGGDLVLVNAGTISANTMYFVTGSGNRIVGTDPIVFDIYSRAENTTASQGIVRVGLDFRLADLGVTTAKIADGAVTNDKITSVAATKVTYSNATSGLTATNAQAAIDEVEARLQIVETSTSTAWQVVSSSMTAVEGSKLLVDTSAGPVIITLPIIANPGESITIRDAKRNTEVNAITIARNGHNIENLAENATFDVNGVTVELVYIDASWGWTTGLI